MQKQPAKDEHHSINEMNALIKSIKCRENNIDDKALAVKLDYREGYISECRSKNFASSKFINRLKLHLSGLENPNSKISERQEESAADLASRIRLEITLQNLSEDKIRTTALLERMVTLIEQQFSFAPNGKAPAGQQQNIPQVDDPAFEDAKLGKGLPHSGNNKPLKKGT